MGKRSSRRERGDGWVFVSAESASSSRPPEPGSTKPVARIRLEKRRGKPVSVVATEGVDGKELDLLAKELRTGCATGGTRRGVEIELQGEHRDRLRAHLKERGWIVKG